jgi:tripartite-type tricarboxylate transporter receptor subunit TctC
VAEFARLAGIKMQHIPYRGSAQAMNDLVGGHLPLQLGSISFAYDFARTGQAKALAVVAERRQAVLPDVPTLVELGKLARPAHPRPPAQGHRGYLVEGACPSICD